MSTIRPGWNEQHAIGAYKGQMGTGEFAGRLDLGELSKIIRQQPGRVCWLSFSPGR